jgi:hypothetical protein
VRSDSTATAPSISPPRSAGATSTPRSRGSGRRHARGLAAWPRRREACACEACEACLPGAVVLEAAAPSAHCSTRSLTIKSGPVDSVLVIGAMTATASTTAASTPAPPLATGPPHHRLSHDDSPLTLTRVALACIYTAHTTSPLTSPPATRTARFHSTARAPAHTFLVPARSPRKTRPARRPPRSARPLVRPTSFMRTTTPRPPPAKAPHTMSRLRCAQTLHKSGHKAASSLQVLCRSSLPRGCVRPARQ